MKKVQISRTNHAIELKSKDHKERQVQSKKRKVLS